MSGSDMLTLCDRRYLENGSTLYSLIDAAKFPGLRRLLAAHHDVEMYSLLGESAQADAAYAGPILLNHDQGAECPLLSTLLGNEKSPGFLTIVVSDLACHTVVRHLSWLTEVRHEDGTEWVMRYYDPLVLPHWLSILNKAQRNAALSGIRQWLYVDARAQAMSVQIDDVNSTDVMCDEPMTLDERQSTTLLDRSLPYMIMHLIEADDGQALADIPPARRYDYFSDQLSKAVENGLVSPTDLKTYCYLSLLLGSDFDRHPLIIKELQDRDAILTFSERVSTWTADKWAMLEP